MEELEGFAKTLEPTIRDSRAKLRTREMDLQVGEGVIPELPIIPVKSDEV